MRMCLHHGVLRWMQIYGFYKGLTNNTQTLIDASTGGVLMKKNENESFTLLEDMASKNYPQPSERLQPPKKDVGTHEIDVIFNLSA